MPRATQGVLVECDSSIKAILVNINADHKNEFIIEDIDEEHLLVRTSQQDRLKALLKEALKSTIKEADEASSESDA